MITLHLWQRSVQTCCMFTAGPGGCEGLTGSQGHLSPDSPGCCRALRTALEQHKVSVSFKEGFAASPGS